MAGNRRTYISSRLKEGIIRDHHDEGLSISDIHRKYKCAYNTVDKIIKSTPYGFWENSAPAKPKAPPVTEIRKFLPDPERSQLLIEDATKIVSLTIQRMMDLLEDPMSNLSATQLSTFLASVAPYTMAKADKKGIEPSKKVNISKLFKDNLKNKAN